MQSADTPQPPRVTDDRLGRHGSSRMTVWRALEAIFNLFVLNILLLLLCLTVLGAPLALRAAVVALDRWRRDGDDRLAYSFCESLRSGPWITPWCMVAVPMAATALATEEVRFFYRRLDVMGGLCTGLGAVGVIVSLAVVGYTVILSARDPRPTAAEAWHQALRMGARNLFRTSLPVVAVLAAAAYLLMADPSLAVIGLPLAALCGTRRLVDRAAPAQGAPADPDPIVPGATVKEVSAR